MAKAPTPKKTETLTLRLDPKAKFAIELLARDQKRTLAGVIEWAVQKALAMQDLAIGGEPRNFSQLVDSVWSPDELERVIYLGACAGHLLSHEESCIWEVVESNPLFYRELERAQNGQPKRFELLRLHLTYGKELIYERANDLSANGTFEPITYDELNRASDGALEAAYNFSAWFEEFRAEQKSAEAEEAPKPEDFGKFS